MDCPQPTVGQLRWVALAMYAWSLIAPKLFPDRDFSGGRGTTNNRDHHEQSQV